MIEKPTHIWTLAAWIEHTNKLQEANLRIEVERELRHRENDIANKAAITVASMNAGKLAEKIESSLTEYKISNNEWRKTVSDLIAVMQGSGKGMREMYTWILGIVMIALTIFNIFYKG